jgi:tetratricopeptide (TPR) repeat protein
MQSLVRLHHRYGNHPAVEVLYQRNVDLYRPLGGSELAYVLHDQGIFYDKMGRYIEAEQNFKEVLEIDQHIFGQDSLEVAQDLNSLAMVYEHAEHQEEAEAA